MNKDLFSNIPLILFLVFFLGPILGSRMVFLILITLLIIFIFKKINKSGKLNSFNFNIPNLNKNNMEERTIDIDTLKSIKNAKKVGFLAAGSILIIWLFFASIVIVEAGETGVYSLFGKVRDKELSSGFHLVIPLAKVTKLTIRTEEYTMSIQTNEGKKFGADAITVLTKEGLSVDLDMTVLYKLSEERASEVYEKVGLNYEEKIIRPAIRTSIRDIIAQYEVKDIYSEKRQEAADKILSMLQGDLEVRGIAVEEVLLRNVVLPDNLAQSIQEKLQAEQEAEKYDFLLAKEKKEKERIIIEAEGQRDAQKIINESLSTNYLYYLYINELKEREGTVYVPTNPSTGMPLFRELGK